MFSYEYCNVFEKSFFHRTPPVAASGLKTFQLFSLLKTILACDLEKQPFADVFQKRYFQKFVQICEEKPVLESLFNIAAGLKACNYIKKRPQHRHFPLNIA